MSRELPARPRFEHLKKHAKALLSELQQEEPRAQLADAQHRLARSYGFTTWSALKAHVLAIVPVHGFNGTWRATLASSTLPPEAQYRSAVLHITVSGDRVTITDIVEDETGPRRHTLTLVADGHERAWAFGYTLTARWVDTRNLEAVVTKNGARDGRVQYELTADGGTLLLEHHRAGDVGAAPRVVVFDRVLDETVRA